MIEENEFWSIATRKNETTIALQYIHSQRRVIIFFSFFFQFVLVVIFNEEGGDENDVGAIPKSSRVALSPMLCISEYS